MVVIIVERGRAHQGIEPTVYDGVADVRVNVHQVKPCVSLGHERKRPFVVFVSKTGPDDFPVDAQVHGFGTAEEFFLEIVAADQVTDAQFVVGRHDAGRENEHVVFRRVVGQFGRIQKAAHDAAARRRADACEMLLRRCRDAGQ